jgi:putative DNA primase/helicase
VRVAVAAPASTRARTARWSTAMPDQNEEILAELARTPRVRVWDRPTVIVNRQPEEVRAQALAALVAFNDWSRPVDRIYRREAGACFLRRDAETDALVAATLSEPLLLARLAAAADWVREGRTGGRACDVPHYVVRVLHALARDMAGVPYLAGVTPTPLVLPDGKLLTEPGYHAESGYFYAPPPEFVLPPIPEHPTSTERARALATLREPFTEFPFANPGSFAAALALLFTILARPAIGSDPTPMLLVEAPMPGTGKGKLVETAAVIALGYRPAAQGAPSTADEWDKRLLAELAAAPRLVFFDNVRGAVKSTALESALTQPTYKGRTLGRSEMPGYPNRAAWVATGNNARVAGDLARRLYLCTLDANCPEPEARSFGRELPAWAMERRAELIAAALTLLRAWVSDGMPGPGPEVPVMGSYERWRHVVGGVLGVAGVPGFLSNRAEVAERVEVEDDGWAEFLAAWQAQHGSAWLTVRELVEGIMLGHYGRHLQPDSLGLREDGDTAKQLGRALGNRARAYVAGFRIDREERKTKNAPVRWRVVNAGGAVFPVSPSSGLPTLDPSPYIVVSGESPL